MPLRYILSIEIIEILFIDDTVSDCICMETSGAFLKIKQKEQEKNKSKKKVLDQKALDIYRYKRMHLTVSTTPKNKNK